ncbi:MAG: aminoacyl-tRNA hydrolase [Candidatus Doudnabacteria bacterium CG10_big_fil_rev_8_21_14_0_10_42_18]|uniref:Peptidyl-tRNA hydrolase n=1 Tax=Candidatus Doudnabacteria bacterium CG10_big_fil_rev_8_21_14_0_10_42_18 TaxID=1974552 RepID=A0A2H0VA30_9BACT|nr:MAG: aminoacyl-tRNA hydrolase [Candidatus Doudnabacteria bacterium CG10_big_fil_rev_8_21_14_0_10_42_18]
MKIVVGLGNPGEKYTNTRHNSGFLAIDDFLKSLNADINPACTKFGSLLVEASLGSEKLFFVKPNTFMNNSGTAVAEIINFYKTDPTKNLLVVHDDKDLPLGTIRATYSSSAAGHNGVQDIIDKLATQNFHRVRIGVESRESRGEMPTEAFVLQNFSDDEFMKLQKEVFPKINLEIEKFIGNLKLEI